MFNLYATLVWFVVTAILCRGENKGIVESLIIACVPAVTWILGIVVYRLCYKLAKKWNPDDNGYYYDSKIEEISKTYVKRIVLLIHVIAVFILGVILKGRYLWMFFLIVVPFEIQLLWKTEI